jgi:hypothetical protein
MLPVPVQRLDGNGLGAGNQLILLIWLLHRTASFDERIFVP